METSEQPRPAAGVDERVEQIRVQVVDIEKVARESASPRNREIAAIVSENVRYLLSALDRSAQECAGLREDVRRLKDLVCKLDGEEAALKSRLASHDSCLAQVREEMPTSLVVYRDEANDLLSKSQHESHMGASIAMMGASESINALCAAIEKLQSSEAAHRAALKEARETISARDARINELQQDLMSHTEHMDGRQSTRDPNSEVHIPIAVNGTASTPVPERMIVTRIATGDGVAGD